MPIDGIILADVAMCVNQRLPPSTFLIFDMYKDFCHHGGHGQWRVMGSQSLAAPTQKPLNAIFQASIQGTACLAGISRYRLIFVNARSNVKDLRDFFAVTAESSSSASGEIRFSTWSLHYQFITLVCRGSF
jgi:hypothetical protein